MQSSTGGAVYVQTNDAEANEVVVYRRGPDGALTALGRHATGGKGSGKPHLASQGSVVLAGDRLLVANAGSDDVSVFETRSDELTLVDRAASGGSSPTSIAAHDDLVYVLNAGDATIIGFRLGSDGLEPVAGSTRSVGEGADPAQAAFSPDGRTLVVTDRGNDALAAFAIGADGVASEPTVVPSAGATPYGFDFTAGGIVVVTEAFGGEVGKAAASSYALEGPASLTPISTSVQDTRSEVCWAVVTRDDRFVYVTNFGDGTISSYAIGPDGALELRDPVAASTVEGEKGVRDEALSADGRYLYALDADARQVFGWHVGDDGSLHAIGAVDGLPATAAGLAAS